MGWGWIILWLRLLFPASCLSSSFEVLVIWQYSFLPFSVPSSISLLMVLPWCWRSWNQNHCFFTSIKGINAFLDDPCNTLNYKTLVSSILHPSLQLQYSHPLLGPTHKYWTPVFYSLTTVSREFQENLPCLSHSLPLSLIFDLIEIKGAHYAHFLIMAIFWHFRYPFQLRPFEYLNYVPSGSVGRLALSTASIQKTLLLC